MKPMAARTNVWMRALRTPLLAALLGGLWVLATPVLVPNLTLLLNYYTPYRYAFVISSLRMDYFGFIPNAVVWLAYLLGGMVFVELKRRRRPLNRTVREDALTAAAFGLYAFSCLAWMGDIKPGVHQLILCALQAGLLWGVLLVNAGLFVVHRAAVSPRGARWLERTFPLSDVIGYQLHRDRLGRRAGAARWAPTACYAAALLLAVAAKGRILWSALPAERVPVPVIDVNSSQLTDGGIWFANGDTWDARSGIWYYDEASRAGYPVIRAADTRRFVVEGPVAYLHDRYDGFVRRVDVATRAVRWEVPAARSGTFELLMEGDRILAVGEGGYVLGVDTSGRRLAERQFPHVVWEGQLVWGDQVAFVSGDQRIRIWKRDLSAGDAIPLPLPRGVVELPEDHRRIGLQLVTNMTAYAPARHVFYAGTSWGEIFRYDVKARRWLPSFRTASGVRSIAADERNGLLFLANYFQGFVDVLELDSGTHVGYILANGRTRYVDLDPATMRGAVSTHGYGLYRFDYAELVRRARGMPAGTP